MSASVTPVRGYRVRLIARGSLFGEDELRAVAFAISGAIGTWLGIAITGLFR